MFLFIIQIYYSLLPASLPTIEDANEHVQEYILTSNCWFLELEEFITNESDDETWFSNSCVSEKNKLEVVHPARRHVSWPMWFFNRNCVDVDVIVIVIVIVLWCDNECDGKRLGVSFSLVSLTTFFRSCSPHTASESTILRVQLTSRRLRQLGLVTELNRAQQARPRQ